VAHTSSSRAPITDFILDDWIINDMRTTASGVLLANVGNPKLIDGGNSL
jgi:hypothetical protein